MQLWRVSGHNAESAQLVHDLEDHRPGVVMDTIRQVAFSPNGELVFAGANDQLGYLWRVSNGNLMHVLRISHGVRCGIMFSRDSALLFVDASLDETRTNVWQTRDGQRQRSIKLAENRWASCSVTPISSMRWRVVAAVHHRRCADAHVGCGVQPGRRSYGGGHRFSDLIGEVWVWRLSDGALVRTIRGEFKVPIRHLAFRASSSEIATMDGKVQLWPLSSTGDADARLTIKMNMSAATMAFSPNGALLITRGYQALQLWRAGRQADVTR